MTTTGDINELAARLSKVFVEGPGTKGFSELFRPLLLLLAKGKPVSPDEIAAAIGKSREEVAALLQMLPDVELDDDGDLIGMGLTLRPTPHRFKVEGRTLFTWCALDALMFPAIIGKPVRIQSPCPVSGTLVRVQVASNKVERVEPSNAVVSVVTPESIADVRSTFCDDVHFFSSPESASEWLAEKPDAVIVSVADAFKLGQILAEHL
ncbi:MAG: organomercurial lyase MerB [Chloroflexi bacterium]|nr:organomercurial lyase MerB [Chloroflexota bacterium]